MKVRVSLTLSFPLETKRESDKKRYMMKEISAFRVRQREVPVCILDL